MDRPVPLAERMRPGKLEGVIGQIDTVSLLKSFVAQGELPSMIFWGPPGCGKTTLCRVLAAELMWDSAILNATSSSVKDIRKLAERAALTWEQWEKRTLVFIDEIHRLNKGQQDVLLPFIESGTFVLLGSTTQNPYYSINKALRSRVQLMTLTSLSPTEVYSALLDASSILNKKFRKSSETAVVSQVSDTLSNKPKGLYSWISTRCGGDLRLAYATLEGAYILASSDQCEPEIEHAQQCLNSQAATGHSTDNHYDLASAFQKSLRGSDTNASVYYLARFLLTGEDPRFIARRLWVTASEDIGNKDPQALLIAQAAFLAVEKLGMPEARIPLTQATIYIANAPKSNQAISAIQKAYSEIKSSELPSIPDHLKDQHQPGLTGEKDYVYTHDHPQQQQQFLPDSIQNAEFVSPNKKSLIDEQRISDYLRLNYQDWFDLDVAKVSSELDINDGILRNLLNELVRSGKLQFRRQFRPTDVL